MSLSNIEILARLISTAQASYGTLSKDSLERDLKTSAGGFTDKEMVDFVNRYELVDQQPNTSSGFSATLFHDKIDNKYIFAIRGTEIPNDAISDLLVSDLGDIRSYGYAADQAVDLYRYWKKLTTGENQAVLYSQAEINRLYLLNHSLLNAAIIEVTSPEYLMFVDALSRDKGLGALSQGAKVDVTGHSLGGNLSYVFASMFPDNVNQVVTDNAPGIRLDGQARLMLLGFSFVDGEKITSVDAEGDLIHLLSVTQQGTVVNISQEVGQTPVVSGLANNHSVVNSVDSLNLMHLFAKLDPSQANNPSGILKDIMRASSNQALDTFENMLDALRKTLLGGAIIETPNSAKGDLSLRNNLYNNLDELNRKFAEGGSLHGLVGRVKFIQLSSNSADAKADYGQFLALYFLTPFALSGSEADLSILNPNLYSLWKADKDLSAADQLAGKQNFSDTWYNDRAKFVERLVSRNTDDTEIDHKNPRREVIYFNDLASNTLLTSVPELVFNGRFSTDQVPTINAFFGGDDNNLFTGNSNQDHFYGGAGNDTLKGEAGFDYLEGNAGNDLLYGGDDADHLLGGAGDDQLVGEAGNDILEGGIGNDTYSFTGAFGSDIIKDADGNGSIVISGETLASLLQSAPGSNVYYDNLTNPTKRAVLLDEGDTKSLIVSTVTQTGKNIITSGNSVTIKNWSNGNLGLNLQATNPTAAADVRTINGTAGNNAITLENVKDSNGSCTAGVTALYADGGAGRDIIMGSLSTNDTLLGGEGSDIISGGFIDNLTDAGYSGRLLPTAATAGKDFIDGGKGNDYIFASVGGGVAHGGDDNDILSSRAGAYFLLNNQEALTEDPAKYNNHGVIKRDDIWGDLLAQRVNFGITVSEGNTYTYDTSITKDLTNAFVEYTGSVTGIHYIAKLGSGNTSYNSSGFGINYSGSYTYAYDYNKENNIYRVISNANLLSPINVVVPQFSLASSHTYAEYANQTGANLFGDKGNNTLTTNGFYSGDLWDINQIKQRALLGSDVYRYTLNNAANDVNYFKCVA